MISTSHQVKTVGGGSRPPILYRVTHSRQPSNGTKSRLGRGSDPIFLQIHLQKHLNCMCREPSPFLSATTCRQTALERAAKYAARGFPDVKVIMFKTRGQGWDHDVQRLWHARSLVDQFGLMKACFDKEYLVEHSIPEKSIVSCLDWKQDKGKLDSSGFLMRKAVGHLKYRNRRLKKLSDARKKEAAENRKAPEPKKRKNGKWVKVGVKVGRNTGA
ncbi:hypothetical protein LY76DRAFT_504679 [Colletotrichum caudatum]|nr:hypothetical protein LY76DRAFT_504679 [Colletotrichum caudatum]